MKMSQPTTKIWTNIKNENGLLHFEDIDLSQEHTDKRQTCTKIGEKKGKREVISIIQKQVVKFL